VPGETDQQYADRIMHLADNISPAAIERTVGAILDPLGIGWCLKETADLETLMGFTFDVHPWDFGGLEHVTLAPNSAYVGQGAVWLGPATVRRFFILCVDRSLLVEFGFGYDHGGIHPLNAWDLGGYDGFAAGLGIAVARVREAVRQTRAAGVRFDVLVDCC
jgi:hypothetical protein